MSITIHKVSMRHRSGTKEYHLLLIQNHSNGKGLVVNRWGKTGTWGQMKTERNSETKAKNMFEDKIREKESRGYTCFVDHGAEASTPEEAKHHIGVHYWAQMGATNLDHVFPGTDTTGVREAKPAVWKETADGKFERDDTPEHSMPTVEDEIAEKKANPNWGLF